MENNNINLLKAPVLSNQQREHFYREGYLVIPDAVPEALLQNALRLINFSLASTKAFEGAKNGSYCKEITSKPAISNLFNLSYASSYAAQLLGQEKIAHGGQIALRFPGTLCSVDSDSTQENIFTPLPWYRKMWHIDGFHSKDNGIPVGEIRNFTLLCGIVLQDVPAEFCGNLIVYPRSHHLLENYFNEHGFKVLATEGVAALPHLPLSTPKQIVAKAGSIVLCHYQLAHSIAPNISSQIRYACYFRLSLRGEGHHPDPMLNIWLDYPGLKDVVEKFKNERQKLIQEYKQSAELGQAGYVDEREKQDLAAKQKLDNERTETLKVADAHFEKHEWQQAAVLYEKIAPFMKDDFFVLLKTAVSLTAGPENTVLKGEMWCQELIRQYPKIANGYVILGQNLNRQQKLTLPKAEELVGKLLDCPVQEPCPSYVIDGLKFFRDLELRVTKQTLKFAESSKKAVAKYPGLEQQILELNNSRQIELSLLWEQGQQWIHAKDKNFQEGQKMFSRLVELQPTDPAVNYWSHVLAGGSYTWGGQAPNGVPYLQKAIEINPDVPHAFSILSQNLMMQGKQTEALDIVKKAIFEKTFTGEIHTNPDHAAKILEMLKVVRQAKGKADPLFQECCQVSSTKYPHIATQIKQVIEGGNETCILQ